MSGLGEERREIKRPAGDIVQNDIGEACGIVVVLQARLARSRGHAGWESRCFSRCIWCRVRLRRQKKSRDGFVVVRSDSPHSSDLALHLVLDIPHGRHQRNPDDPSYTVTGEFDKVAHVVAAVRRLLEEAAWLGAVMSGRKTSGGIWVDGVDEGFDALVFLLVGYRETAAKALRVHMDGMESNLGPGDDEMRGRKHPCQLIPENWWRNDT